MATIRKEKDIALTMASTGIASLLLDGGNTAHTTLKLPLQVNSDSMCNIKLNSPLAKIIAQCKIFVWDEAPNMSKYYYEAVDRTFRDIMKQISPEFEYSPFGG